MSIESINLDAYTLFVTQALENGIWDGRPVSYAEAPHFTDEVIRRISRLAIPQDSTDIDAYRMAVHFALGGATPEQQSEIMQEARELGLRPDGMIIQVGLGKSINKFWKKHKVAICVGVATVAIITVIAIATLSSGGAAAGAIAAAGATASNSDSNERPKQPSFDKPQNDHIQFDSYASTVEKNSSESSLLKQDIVFVENGVLQNGEYLSYSEILHRGRIAELFQIERLSPVDSPIDSISAQSVPNEVALPELATQENVIKVGEDPSHSKDRENITWGEKAKNIGSTAAHKTLEAVTKLTFVVPQLLEDIKSAGQQILPDSLLLPDDGLEITPMENFKTLVAAGHEKIDQLFSTDQAGLYTPEAQEVRDSQFAVGILPPPGMFTKISFSTKQLAETGKAIDRAGFTKAGRGLMKHGYRDGSAFPRPTGNPEQVNAQGQKVLESLLNHPEKVVYEYSHPSFGKVIEVAVPGKGGARFTADGKEMIGFLEP